MTESRDMSGEGASDPAEERDAPARPAWQSAHRVLLVVGAVALAIWLATGFYQVGVSEVAIVERLGQYVALPSGKPDPVPPGFHWGFPWPIDRVEKVSVQQTHQLSLETFDASPRNYDESRMQVIKDNEGIRQEVLDVIFDPYLITADLSVVHLRVQVQYRISDVYAYTQAVAEMPGHDLATRDELLHRVIEHEAAAAVGHFPINTLFGEQTLVEQLLRKRLRDTMVTKDGAPLLGIRIEEESVKLSAVRVPTQVVPSFNLLAQEIAQKGALRAQAEGAKSAMILEAEAQAKATQSAAKGYQARIESTAKGEAERFAAIMTQYNMDPDTAKYDLWQNTMKDILNGATRIFFVEPDEVLNLTLEKPEKTVDAGSAPR
jgi:modulator of FtsH protease HflK